MMSHDLKKVSIFTKDEKQKIDSEFQYYNKRSEQIRSSNQVEEPLPTDPFAEQQLGSTQNSELRNITSRSIILAPFNSTRQDGDGLHNTEGSAFSEKAVEEIEIRQLLVPKRQIIRFSAKVKEIDRQYELNNNAELDNGVYHENSQDDEQKSSQLSRDLVINSR